MINPEKNTVAAVLIILVVAGFFFFFKLGERSLYNPDEGRYAEVAREMVLRNDWVEPRLFNVDYLAKPILFYWLTMLSFKTLGISEFSARFMPVLFGLMGILATFFFVKRTVNLRSAFYTALILASSFWYMQVSRFVVIDIVFTFFIICSLYAYYIAVTDRGNKTFFYLIFYICLAFSFLAKGFACFVLTGFPICLYLLFGAKLRYPSLKRRHMIGIAVFLAIISTWLVRIIIREPGFLESFVVNEHIKRFTSPDFEHQEPWFFFLTLVPVLCIPWTFFIVPIKRAFSPQSNDRRDLNLFLLCSGIGIIFFFSISRTKLATYCMPAFPFLCIFFGCGWSALYKYGIRTAKEYKIIRASIALTALCGVGTLIAVIFFSRFFVDKSPITSQLSIGGSILLVGSLICFSLLERSNIRGIFYVLIGSLLLISLQVNSAMGVIIDKNYSSKSLVKELKKVLRKDDIVYIFGNPNKFYDLPFYLGQQLDQTVRLIDLLGELKPEKIAPAYEEGEVIPYITRKQFIEQAIARKPFYCAIQKKKYKRFTPKFRSLFSVIYDNDGKLIIQSGKLAQ